MQSYIVKENHIGSVISSNTGQYWFYFSEKLYNVHTSLSRLGAKKLIIPNDVTQNYPFCRLKLAVLTFEHLT